MIHLKLDATDSTNSYLKDLVREGKPRNWTVVSARQQTRGRGQQGAFWFSDIDKNLTFSILIMDTGLRATEQFLLNCAVSIGMLKVLKSLNIPRLKVKWPNDIMSGSSKLAGILIENSLIRDSIAHSIVGIGLNVNQDLFPAELAGAVSMKERTGEHYNLEDLLDRLITHIKEEMLSLETSQFEKLRSEYAENMYRKNAPSMFKLPGGKPFVAEIRGVTNSGLLILRDEDGKDAHYAHKEVEYL